ncbi:unnamed protein product [Effrenium voratum]|nr:unnamed protein product [Effrenium voratum]
MSATGALGFVAPIQGKQQLQHITLLSHPEECRGWVFWGEKHGFDEAKQKQNSTYAHRDNGRIEFNSPDIAYQLWLRIKGFVPERLAGSGRAALGCSPRIRVYRYVKGQRFGQHVDGSRDEPEMGGRTHFTVLVYLNGGDRDKDIQVKGGETVFWKDHDGRRPALAFPPTRGVCLFHGHGDECMTHEGAGVEDGAKYVLRTDVVYEFPAHVVPILTSVVIECQRAKMPGESYQYACTLMKPEYRKDVSEQYKKKIENIVRKPPPEAESRDALEASLPCMYCGFNFAESQLDCLGPKSA